MPWFSIDSASRAAMANLFRTLRREYHASDIRFVLFSPSGVNTEAECNARGIIWEKTKVRLMEPDKMVRQFLRNLAQGRTEIILAGLDEKLLAFLDVYCPRLADMLFFNNFIKKMDA